MVIRSMFAGVALAVGLSTVCWGHLRTIGERTARRLVEEALVAEGENRAAVHIGPWDYYWAPEFYTFSAWRHNLADGLLVTHYFAVNPWTGDVWDAMGCKRITSPAIEREREGIRKRSGLPQEAWEILQAKSPACSAVEQKTAGARKRRSGERF